MCSNQVRCKVLRVGAQDLKTLNPVNNQLWIEILSSKVLEGKGGGVKTLGQKS